MSKNDRDRAAEELCDYLEENEKNDETKVKSNATYRVHHTFRAPAKNKSDKPKATQKFRRWLIDCGANVYKVGNPDEDNVINIDWNSAIDLGTTGGDVKAKRATSIL